MLKNAVIFGDSYSTFKNYIPEGNAVYYSEEDEPQSGLTKVTQTWWHLLANEAGLNIVLNDSWSGSTIGYTGYDNVDCSRTSSFIHRLNTLKDADFFAKNAIDTVFVFGGTNDSWADAPLGAVKFDDFQNDDLYCVLPAICYFLMTLKNTLPDANLYCLINTELKPEITDCFEKACEKYGVTKIVFDKIDKVNGHPTVQGMQDIKNTAYKVLNK